MINVEELFGKDYNEFTEVDPFNPQNTVSGFISRKPNEFYGALIITQINDKEVSPRLIMGSPKMHYPFTSMQDGSRKYNFPIAKYIEVYEKIDGTNVVAYFYSDGDYRYATFKTRLRPFLSSGRFGDFLSLWKEVASGYFTEIEREMDRFDCNLSFELYGSRNTHLLIYDEPLAFKLLFGVTNEGKILSPAQLSNPNLPILEPLKMINKDFASNYEATQKELQDKLTQPEEGYYCGMEGTVWYLHTPDGKCVQLKCKPEAIEAIHFAQGVGISKNSIIATCWNAFENTDTLTSEFIEQLLLEEFPQHQIEANHILIQRCIIFVTEESNFKKEVLETYKQTGMNILLQKADVMRQLSSKFPKNKMKKVYSIIAKV
jgi:hypothetical protein